MYMDCLFSSLQKEEENQEYVIQGVSLSEGIALGAIYFPEKNKEIDIPKFAITADQIDREIDRYRKAIALSRADLEHLQSSLEGEGLQEAVSIISAHLEMLKDPVLTTEVEGKIRKELYNIESVFRSTMQEFSIQFSEGSAFFQQRLVDVMDVSQRIFDHLRKTSKRKFQDAPLEAILFTGEIDASMTASVQTGRVIAFVTIHGATSSHAALIARSRGIPYVRIHDLSPFLHRPGQKVLVDGCSGRVIINPTEETVAKYFEKDSEELDAEEVSNHHVIAKTRDGHLVDVLVNIGSLEEVKTFSTLGAKGIGLLRTELFFSGPIENSLSETIQYETFVQVALAMKGKPMVVRLFDFGGDKPSPEGSLGPNKLLGGRGITHLLKRSKVLKTQIRALLRAALHGNMKILLPHVSDIGEIKKTREIILEVSRELIEEGIVHRKEIPIGCMLEVPSALLLIDSFCRVADFFSIGTNDLTQYVLGVDRGSSHQEAFYQSIHPAVLRLMHMAIHGAHEHRRPISVCGDMASRPLFIPLILGLGIREISVMPRLLSQVQTMIRSISIEEAMEVALQALTTEHTHAIEQLLRTKYGALERTKYAKKVASNSRVDSPY